MVFDNAGIGKTGTLPSPLGITGMANQASALISALGLGRTAVLGWSMGGMIAQALAVLHPAQVSRLILAATQPGTGRAVPIPAAAAAAAASPDPATVLSVLFPPGQAAAERTYVIGILRYPDFYQAPRATTVAQELAVEQWIAGKDPAGLLVPGPGELPVRCEAIPGLGAIAAKVGRPVSVSAPWPPG